METIKSSSDEESASSTSEEDAEEDAPLLLNTEEQRKRDALTAEEVSKNSMQMHADKKEAKLLSRKAVIAKSQVWPYFSKVNKVC